MKKRFLPILVLLGLGAGSAFARTEDVAYLFVGGKQTLSLASLPNLPVQKRARIIRNTILSLVQKGGTVQPFSLEPEIGKGKEVVLFLRGIPVVTATWTDARRFGTTPEALASLWANNLRAGLSLLKVGLPVPDKFVLLMDRSGNSLPIGWEDLEEEVRGTLSMAAPDVVKNVKVSISDGLVILTGFVDTLASKSQAESLSAQVSQVRAIDNQLVVVPKEPSSDERIRQDIERILSFHSLTREASIKVSLSGGGARLEGYAPTLLSKTLATDLAGRVRGLLEIENKIEVCPVFSRSDEDIQADLLLRLSGNSTIARCAAIDTTVSGGRVTLGGCADSLLVRLAALDEARRISGVTAIEDHIEVRPVQ